MLDILCDFLMISKDATNGVGVTYPKYTNSSIMITESKIDGTPPRDKNIINNARGIPPASAAIVT